MNKLRIIVIGRGLAGLSMTWRLVRAGFRPLVLGQRDGLSNASHCAQGIVCNKGLLFAESPLFRAKLKSLRRLEPWLSELEKASGLSISRHRGVLEPYWSHEDFTKTVQRVYRGNFWGCYRPQNRPADDFKSDLADLDPAMGYLHYPDDAWFDVDSTLRALETACRRYGAEFVDDMATGLSQTEHGISVLGRIAAYPSDHAVLASGAQTIELLTSLGIRPPKHFLIGGQSLRWVCAPRQKPVILVKANHSLALLNGMGICGSSSWKSEPGVNPDLFEDASRLCLQMKQAFGSDLQHIDRDSIQARQGIRLRFTDRMPALGIMPDPALKGRLSILSGFYKNGLQLADICAEQLMNELTGKPLDEFGVAFHCRRLLPGAASNL